MRDHFQCAAQALERFGLDAVLVTGESNRRYVTGFPSSAGAALVTKKRAYFFTDARYIEAAQNAVSGAVVLQTDGKHPYADRINDALAENRVEKLGFEDGEMTVSAYTVYREKLKAELVPAQKLFVFLRQSKSREDLETMIRAQRIAESALEGVLPMLRGSRERDIAAELVYRMVRAGAEDKSFDPIVVSGTKTSMPHGVPDDTVIGDGFVTIDFGCRVDGYCSDETRTFCLGSPTDEMVRVYDTVLAAQKAGIAAAKAGVPGREIDAAGRAVIEQAGYGAYFGHAFGHSLGLDIHEAPNASPLCGDPIPAGAVISAEPGIYLPGRFGVRIEDVLYITADGCEDITKTPRNLIIL